MWSTIKELIPLESYNKYGYIVLMLFIVSSGSLIGRTTNLDQKSSLTCIPSHPYEKLSLADRNSIQQSCARQYRQEYNSPLPLWGFISLNFALIMIVSICYAIFVKDRTKQYKKSYTVTVNKDIELQPLQITPQVINDVDNAKRSSVFYIYLIHLIINLVILVLFAVLVYRLRDYPTEFTCVSLPSSKKFENYTNAECISSVAQQRKNCSIAFSVINFVLVLVTLRETIRIVIRAFKDREFTTDFEFCEVYLLLARKPFDKLIKYYTDKLVFDVRLLPFGKEKHIKDVYIPLVIKEGRDIVHPNISERHEIYDVDLEQFGKVISNIEDIFNLKDSNKKIATKILVVGRPGIGKSVLSQKILYNFTTSSKKVYKKKVVLLLKFRDFNSEEQKTLTLRDLLLTCFPDNKDFESIYQYILDYPERVILLFDGLDELKIHDDVNFSKIESQDGGRNKTMNIFYIFAKLIYNQFLPGATVITTIRSTAWDSQYSRDFGPKFHKTVEILGFTGNRIKKYMTKYFGDNKEKRSKIVEYVFGSPELTSLCYIPVTCLITCFTLDRYFSDLSCVDNDDDDDDEFLPKTLTELYQIAIRVILWHHHPKYKDARKKPGYSCSDARLPDDIKEKLVRLKQIAHNAMLEKSLIFPVDENESSELTKCGLLYSSSKKYPLQCSFIHLTIQEFLAASHLVDEISNVKDLKEYLSKHVNDVNWELVTQFLVGLLGDKFRSSLEVLKKLCEGAQRKNGKLAKVTIFFRFTVSSCFTGEYVKCCFMTLGGEG